MTHKKQALHRTVEKVQISPRGVSAAPSKSEAPQVEPEEFAHYLLHPTVQAAFTLLTYNKTYTNLTLPALLNDLVKQCDLANDGDMKRAEAILTAQAHSLDSIFNHLAQRASKHMGCNMDATETYLRLALKAQSQCRATLETLGAIKNPQPVAFVHQANIAHGAQQINNAVPQASSGSGTRETENSPNELMENQDGKQLGLGAKRASIASNSKVEALEKVHRTKNTKR